MVEFSFFQYFNIFLWPQADLSLLPFSRFKFFTDEDEDYDNKYKNLNEREEDVTTNYTTATMSGDAEAAYAAELEDTAADVSNIEGADEQVNYRCSQTFTFSL